MLIFVKTNVRTHENHVFEAPDIHQYNIYGPMPKDKPSFLHFENARIQDQHPSIKSLHIFIEIEPINEFKSRSLQYLLASPKCYRLSLSRCRC